MAPGRRNATSKTLSVFYRKFFRGSSMTITRRAISFAYRVHLISVGFSTKNPTPVGASYVCVAHTKRINNNKIESNFDQYMSHQTIADADFLAREVSHG